MDVNCEDIIWFRSLSDGGVSSDTYKGWNFNSGNYLFTTDTK